MKLWIDDVRPAPSGYYWVRATIDAINICQSIARKFNQDKDGNRYVDLEVLDLDHDAGEYAKYGGDYIEILKWLEEHEFKNLNIHIHSMNPVGVWNMRAIIKANEKNGWRDV